MTAPSVKITKTDGQTGAVKPSPDGILAIIAAAQKGTQNQAAGYARQDLALNDFGYGPLVECAAYDMAESGNQVVLIRPTASVAGAYGSITSVISGGCVVTAGGTAPLDEYANVQIKIVTGGTVGVAGIVYTYSLDGGNSVSANQALGTATTLTIPNSGVSFNLTSSTLIAGDSWSVYTTRPQMNNTDLIAALEALRVSKLPWENVLIDMDAVTANIQTVDTWLSTLEGTGEFHAAFLNTRHKNEPVPTQESEATFATDMTNRTSTLSSIRLALGTDAGDATSPVTGLVQPRPVSLAAAARCASIPVGTDPAYVALGAIGGFTIADGSSNPKWHDEQLYPGLDDQRLGTFRSIPGEQGTYLTNVPAFSPSGSDYVYIEHVRIANKAANIAYQLLIQQLSRGVGKAPPNPVTKGVYILEQDAQLIEGIVNAQLRKQLKGQVNDVALVLSRTDDISANSGATINAQLQIQALAYIKRFQVNLAFVKAITVSL